MSTTVPIPQTIGSDDVGSDATDIQNSNNDVAQQTSGDETSHDKDRTISKSKLKCSLYSIIRPLCCN
jgi:hypothetical protein